MLWCPMHKEARRHLLRTTGWPRGETQLVADDAVKWTVPDAAQAQCAEEVLATAVQELCHRRWHGRGTEGKNDYCINGCGGHRTRWRMRLWRRSSLLHLSTPNYTHTHTHTHTF